MKQYRKTNKVVEQVLQATQNEGRDGIKVTKLMNRSNLHHSRLKKLLGKLISNEMIVEFKIKNKQTFVITEKGIQYLEQYKKYNELAESFGMEL